MKRQRCETVKPTRAVAYIRVSTASQADHGVSLAAQEAKLRAFAALYDLALAEVVVDAAESARSLDRPGLQRCLAMLRRGEADALAVVKLDRLTRSVRDLGELVERYFCEGKAALLSVTEQIDTRTAGGRLVLNVLGAVAAWERESIGERTSAALQHKAANGEYVGGRPPFGWRLAADGQRLEEQADEQAIIRVARALRAEGLSLRAVAARLHALGHRSRAGREFGSSQVAGMVG